MLELTGLAGPYELLLFMTAVFVLNATPGVDLLLTVTRTLQGGARAGIAAALGIGAGCVVQRWPRRSGSPRCWRCRRRRSA